MPFAVLEGFPELKTKAAKLRKLPALGFTPCKFFLTNRPLTQKEMENGIQQLRDYAKENDIPIDGIVLTYNDIAFSESCGRTRHHYKDGVAFKFEDEAFETPFDGLMAFSDATALWGPNESTLRKAIHYGKLINGVDVCKFGKQWVVSMHAMKREYGEPSV